MMMIKETRKIDHIAGIVLAAGKARRFGAPKQLLLWKGVPFVKHICNQLFAAGIREVIVITGAYDHQIREVLDKTQVTVVHNHDWKKGISTTVRAGIQAVSDDIRGAMICLADQPQIPLQLIKKVLAAYTHSNSKIYAPFVKRQRANPVLFSRDYFPALEKLKGDQGAKSILTGLQIERVPWEHEDILMDVDTSQDWQDMQRTMADEDSRK